MRRLLIFLIFISTVFNCSPARKSSPREREFQKKWCLARGGRLEVVLSDNTRCDCVTPTHAIEFDFASKRLQALGQAINYSELTGLRAGIVLICKNSSDRRKYLLMKKLLSRIRKKYPVRLWEIDCVK